MMLLEVGETVPTVSEYLGHASPAVTMAVYAHAVPGAKKRAAERLGAIIRRARSEPEDVVEGTAASSQGSSWGSGRQKTPPSLARRGLSYLVGTEATVGIEPTHRGFANPCLTTWLRRPGRCSAPQPRRSAQPRSCHRTGRQGVGEGIPTCDRSNCLAQRF
jgi:hypothetical protein